MKYFLLFYSLLSSISFSQEIKPDDTLPVELIYFYSEVESLKVKLFWGTATEVNNYGYDVERKVGSSEYGVLRNPEWEMVGFVFGHGNSNSPKDYYFEDTTITENGEYLYRLKQIDTDGVFEYSDTINVTIDFVTSFVENNSSLVYNLSQNYPNPFNPVTTIEFSLTEKSYVSLNLYDIRGNEVSRILNKEKEAGNYKYLFNGINLTSGVYFCKMSVTKNGNTIYSKSRKMILLK